MTTDRRCLQWRGSNSSVASHPELHQSGQVEKIPQFFSPPLNPEAFVSFFQFCPGSHSRQRRRSHRFGEGFFLARVLRSAGSSCIPLPFREKATTSRKNKVSIKRVGGVEVDTGCGFELCAGNRKGETGQRRGGRLGPFRGGRGVRWNK